MLHFRHASHFHNVQDGLRPLADLYEGDLVTTFGPLKLKAVREGFIQRKLSRSTINKHIGTIKRVFKWGTENEMVPSNVYHALAAVSGLRHGRSHAKEGQPVKPVAPQHIEAILLYVSREVAAMISLQEVTGMRPGEVTIMRGCDLDMRHAVWTYVPATHKTEHHDIERPIYLGPKAQEIIKPFLKTDLTAYLFNPQEAIEMHRQMRRAQRKTAITPSQAARRRKSTPRRAPKDHYTTESYRRAIARACLKADRALRASLTACANEDVMIPRWHPHQLRHNAATRLRKEFGIEAARVVLGHRSAAVTEVHAELDHRRAAEIMARVG